MMIWKKYGAICSAAELAVQAHSGSPLRGNLMNLTRKLPAFFAAAIALPAYAAEPSVNGHTLPSDAQINAFIEHDRQLVRERKAPAELVEVDTEIGQSLREAKKAAAANDTAKIVAMDPRVRALLDRRKALVGNTATQPTSGNPGYAQMLQWDRNAVEHSAADPVILKYDAQMVNLQPGSPAYERLARLKLEADRKWGLRVTGGRMIQTDPCQDPMGRNTCAAPPPVYDNTPSQAEIQYQQEQEQRQREFQQR